MKHPHDCEPDCPGDPICPHTDLARIAAREDAIPAMRRVRVLVEHELRRYRTEQERQEVLYLIVCAAEGVEPAEPVDGQRWPYRLPDHYRSPE